MDQFVMLFYTASDSEPEMPESSCNTSADAVLEVAVRSTCSSDFNLICSPDFSCASFSLFTASFFSCSAFFKASINRLTGLVLPVYQVLRTAGQEKFCTSPGHHQDSGYE